MKKAILRGRFKDVEQLKENLEKKEEVKEEKPKTRRRKGND